MVYADFEYYSENWTNIVIRAKYKYYAIQATQYINNFTFDRIDEIILKKMGDNIRLCQCEIIDYLYKVDSIEITNGSIVTKETLGDVSVSFEQAKGIDFIIDETKIFEMCCKWLPINLISRGIC